MIKEKLFDSVFHSQSVFRLALDAMARPGKLVPLEAIPILPPAPLSMELASLAFSLINRDVSFCTLGFDDTVDQYLLANTASRLSEVNSADFILCNGLPSPEVVKCAKTGVLTYPETSASIYAQVEHIGSTSFPGAIQLALSGPGIKQESSRWISKESKGFFEALSEVNHEFPLGIDVLLVSPDPAISGKSMVMGIPRTTQIRIIS